MTFEKKDEDEIEFVDAESYMPSDQGALSYEQIVLEQIRRCVAEGSKEMSGGYFKEKQTTKGMLEVYVPDQREIYIQSVQSLHDLLLTHFDEKMIDGMKKVEDMLKAAKDKQMSLLKKKAEMIKDQRTKTELMMQVQTGLVSRNSSEARQFAEDRVYIHRLLFQELMLLYGRQRYLMTQAIMD